MRQAHFWHRNSVIRGKSPRIAYWLKNQPVQNFGDTLSELLFEALTEPSIFRWGQGRLTADYAVVHLIGSVLSDWHIEKDLEDTGNRNERPIAFWGCGLRSEEPLRQELLARCALLGVRGPLTRSALGLGPDVPIGDPGLLMPLIYAPKMQPQYENRTICVPHFLERKSDSELLAMTGCDLVLRPNIAHGRSHLERFLDALVSAEFVLAGALHAAIVAYAYAKPFAYFDSGYIDVPFKWRDFAASIDMPPEFVRSSAAGLAFYQQHGRHYTMPPLDKLVACAPFRPSKRLVKATEAATRSRGAAKPKDTAIW